MTSRPSRLTVSLEMLPSFSPKTDGSSKCLALLATNFSRLARLFLGEYFKRHFYGQGICIVFALGISIFM